MDAYDVVGHVFESAPVARPSDGSRQRDLSLRDGNLHVAGVDVRMVEEAIPDLGENARVDPCKVSLAALGEDCEHAVPQL